MVKHIVAYTFKEGVDKDASVALIGSLLEPLVGKIHGLMAMEIRACFQGGMDYCLYSEFESRQALVDTRSIRCIWRPRSSSSICWPAVWRRITRFDAI